MTGQCRRCISNARENIGFFARFCIELAGFIVDYITNINNCDNSDENN